MMKTEGKIAELEKEILALRNDLDDALMCAWRPMETAPKDGTYILLYAEKQMLVGAFNDWTDSWYAPCPSLSLGVFPVCWMPLPQEPKL